MCWWQEGSVEGSVLVWPTDLVVLLGFPFLTAFESFNAMTHDLLVSNDLYMQGSLAFHDCIFKMHLIARPVRVRVTQDQNRIDIACMGNYICVSLYGMGE